MFKYYFLFLIVSLNIIHGLSQECVETEDRKPVAKEMRLRADLLCNYNKHFIPLHNRSEVMSVAMSMDIIEFDISEMGPKKIYLESKITVKWHDVFLMWKPKDYDSLAEIEMNTDEIWSPQILPEEMDLFSSSNSILASTECRVSSWGGVSCTVISSHTGFCSSDVSRWPWDEHECGLQYMVWSYSEQHLDIAHPANDTLQVRLMRFEREWSIVGKKSTLWQGGRQMSLTISEMYFQFNVVRKVQGGKLQFYFLSIFVMTSLTLMCFWANFEATDRLILSLINVIYHILMIIDMEYKFPRLGHTVPYLLCFYRDSVVLAFILLVETMVFKKILTSDKPTPSWLVTFERTIGRRIIGKLLLVDGEMVPKNSEQGSFEDELRYIKESKHMEKRRTVQIIDRIFFIGFVVAYFIIITILLTF